MGLTGGCEAASGPPRLRARATVTRLPGNPIIVPAMLPMRDGENINGPPLIRVPPWITGAPGRYYLYFAHHAGTYIRLAYADTPEGPWTVYAPGTLRVDQTICQDVSGAGPRSAGHVLPVRRRTAALRAGPDAVLG